MLLPWPDSWGSLLREKGEPHNKCHLPGGSSEGGQFCSDPEAAFNKKLRRKQERYHRRRAARREARRQAQGGFLASLFAPPGGS